MNETRLNDDTIEYSDGGRNFREAMEALADDAKFRGTLTGTLRNSPFDAFFWETPPVLAGNFDRPFEFVLVNGPTLATLAPDPRPFSDHFARRDPSETVLTFPNLGGDAFLVVPAPIAGDSAYPHLAAFLRQAPAEQVDEFWRLAGASMLERISDRPTWLSTAGLGVSWLHLRLDSRPKYYRHGPYRDENP